MQEGPFLVERALNNNVLVVRAPDNREEILVGKGLGFGVRHGTEIDDDDPRIEKRYGLVNEQNRKKFQQLYAVVHPEVIGVAEEIIARVEKDSGTRLHEHIHVALPDHIGFALTRLRSGFEIENPFVEEVRTLYPKAWTQAQGAADLIHSRFGIPIPASEVGFLALHIHAATAQSGLSDTIKVADGVNVAVKVLEEQIKQKIPKDTLDYARLVTHLRFAIQRVLKGECIVNPLSGAIQERLPASCKAAKASAEAVEHRLNLKFPEDEIAYLALHVARLTGERESR